VCVCDLEVTIITYFNILKLDYYLANSPKIMADLPLDNKVQLNIKYIQILDYRAITVLIVARRNIPPWEPRYIVLLHKPINYIL